MTWIIAGLLAPLFWAGSNIFDKYALEKVSKGTYDFLFFGTLGSVLMTVLTILAFGIDQMNINALWPLAAGFMVQLSYLFYSYALKEEDASYVVPLYMTYAVIVLILGPLFGETVNQSQFFAFIVTFIGALVLSLKELSLNNIFKYRKGALMMVPATILVSFAFLFTDQSLEVLSFTDTFIYDFIGFSIAGFSLMLIPSWRREIINGIKTANLNKYSLFFVNDLLDMSGHIIYKYSLLLAPSAGLVAVLNGIQPFYVLILGILFTIFLPKIITENISKKEILQKKIIGAIIIFAGILILSIS